MATSADYANWLRNNQAKRGTPDYATVLRAYQEAALEESQAQQAPPVAPAAPKPESGFFPALRAGATELGGGIAALAGKIGLKDEAAAQAEYDAAQKRAREIFAPTEAGWTEAFGTKFLELLGGSVPYMAAPLAAGVAAATLPITGPAAVATTLGAAGLTSAAQFTATNLSRQLEEGKKLADTELGKAAAAAVPMALLDTLSMRLIPGIGRIFGQAGIKVTAETAKEIAEQGLKKTLIDYTAATGKTMGVEGLTEATQQFFERLQAGLSVTDAKAREEYFDSLIGGAVLGGTLAVPGRYYERSKAQGEARTLLEGETAKQREAARKAAEAEKQSPEYLETRYDAYQKLLAEKNALDAQIKKGTKEAPLTQEDKDANAVLNRQLAALKKPLEDARQEFISAGGPQAMAKLRAGRLGLTAPPGRVSEPVAEEAAPEAPAEVRPRYEREVRGLTDALEQQRKQMLAAKTTEEAVRIAAQAQKTKAALDTARAELGKLPALPVAPQAEELQAEAKKLAKKFAAAKESGNQDKVLEYGKALLDIQARLKTLEPEAQQELFAPETIAAEQQRRDALGEEMAVGRETAAYERQQQRIEQETAREEAARRAAVDAELAAEGTAEREAMSELGQRLARAQRGREMERVRTAPQLSLFPEPLERVEQETTVAQGEVRRLQEQIAELEKRRAEKQALPQEELAGALSREPGQIVDIDRQLADMRQRLDDLREGEMERRTVRMPPEAPQVDLRPQPELTQRISAMANRVLASPSVAEDTKDVVRQMQADLPAFLRQAKAPPTAAWLYRTLTTGRADPADTAKARNVLRTLEEAKRSETETLPSGEIRRAVQQEFPEMPEPRATAFGTYKEFEEYLGTAAPIMMDAQKQIALSVSRLQRELAPLRDQAAELRKQEAELKEKAAALKGKAGAERARAQALVDETQFSLAIARNALENNIERVIAARATAVQKYSDGLTEGISILLDIADGAKQFEAQIAAREPIQVSRLQERRDALEARRSERQKELSKTTDAAEKTEIETDIARIEARLSKLPKGFIFERAVILSGDLPAYTAVREAENKVEQALDAWVSAQTNMRDVVQRNIGADWGDTSTALGEYLVAKKRVDDAGKTVWNARDALRKLTKQRKDITPLSEDAFGDFLVKQAELAAKLDVELKRISGLSKYVKGIAKNADVDAYLKQRDAAQIAFSKALRKLSEGGDVGALLRTHMKPLEDAQTALADKLGTYGGTPEQLAAFDKARADLKAAEELMAKVAVATRPDDAQAEQLLAAARTPAVQAGRLEARVESRLAEARARAEARTQPAPTLPKTTLTEREAADAAKRRAEQASLEAGERAGVMVFFDKNKEDIMADTNYVKLVEQAYDPSLSSQERMQAATEADKYMQEKRARIDSRAEEASAASLLHEENLKNARAKLDKMQALRGKKRTEKTAAKLEYAIKKQEAVIAGHQAKLNKSLTGTKVTRMSRADLKAVREQANAEILRTRVAGERLGVAEGTQPRAIGPATRPEVIAPKTMRTGSEESRKKDLTTTPSRNRVEEARGVRQRDVAMNADEIAEANRIAAELAKKTPEQKAKEQKEETAVQKEQAKLQAAPAKVTPLRSKEPRRLKGEVISETESVEENFEPEILGGGREEVFFSRGPTANPSTTDSVRTELKKVFPDLGRVQIYDSVDALIAANPQYKGKIPADARGFVDSAGNKAFLIAENINQGQALSVLLHEVGAHVGLKSMLGDAQYNALVKAVETWSKRNDGSTEARVAQAAQARVAAAETPAAQRQDELLAYAVEEAVNAGVKPMETKGPLGQWLSRVAAAFRRALEKFGLPPKALDAQGLVDLAFGAAKMEMTPAVPQMSRRTFLRGASAALGALKLPPLSKDMQVSALKAAFEGSLKASDVWFAAANAAVGNNDRLLKLLEEAERGLARDPLSLYSFLQTEALRDFFYDNWYITDSYTQDEYEEYRDENIEKLLSGKDGVKIVADLQQALQAQRAELLNAVQKAAKEKGLLEVGELFFSKNLPIASRVANQIVGEQKGWLSRLKDNFLGLGGRAQFVDKLAPTEEAFKRADADPTKALQAMYYLRMYDQRMHFTSQAITEGVPERVEKTRRDGIKEFLIEAKPGANLKKAFDILARKDVVKEAGSADAANKLITLYMAAIRGERVGYDKLNFGRVWAQGEIKRVEGELKSTKLSAEQRTVLTKRMNRLENRLDSMPTPEDIKAAKAEIDANPVLRDAFNEVRDIYNQYNRDLLNFNVQSGSISRETANTLLQQNDYIPYYRMRDGVAELIIGGETPIRIGNLKDSPHLQELVGGDEPIMDFITSSIQNTSMLIDMATHNLAMRNLMFEFKNLGLATVGKVKGGNAPSGAVTFKLDGVEHFGVVDTEALGISSDLLVKGLAGIPTMFPAFVRVMGMPARFLRRVVVASPLYMARQLFRDSTQAAIASGANTIPILNALKQIGKPNALERRGITGGQVFTDMPEDMANMIKAMQAGKFSITNGLSYLEAKAAQVDALTRRSQYESYLKQGLSEMEATYMALESMNFSRRGLSPTIHMASTLIPFFNAQIQGLDVLYRSFTGQMPMNERLEIRKKLFERGMMLFGLSMAYAMAMQDDEAYKNAKPEEKYGNWFVYIPGVEQPIRLPIPFELGYVFKALPEAIVNTLVNEKGGEEALKALKHIVQQMIPGGSSFMIPQAVKPLAEVGFGVSIYTGRDIEPAREQQFEPGYRARESTTALAKAVGEMTGFSPIKLEYLINGYTGQLGMAALAALSAPFAGAGEGPTPATKRPSDLPLIGTLFQPKDASGIIDLVYERMNKVRQVQATYKELLTQGKTEQAERYAKEKADDLSLASVAGQFRQQMGEITDFERQVRVSNLSPDRKRQELDRARQAKIRLAQAAQAVAGRRTPQAALAE